ncbi:MAG: hypothetical protein ACK56F_30970, partial [bacterium]
LIIITIYFKHPFSDFYLHFFDQPIIFSNSKRISTHHLYVKLVDMSGPIRSVEGEQGFFDLECNRWVLANPHG